MTKKTIVQKEFFDRPVLDVAHDLLGKYLVRRKDGEERAYMITEVEAYDGPDDKACHASKGRTERTEVMFGEAGVWYVYLVYGMYDMLNVVTGEKEYPAAVLIRGVEGISGPGKITKRLGVTRSLNAKAAAPKSGLWIEDRGVAVPEKNIVCTPRIGVAYAKEWAHKPYRFVLKD